MKTSLTIKQHNFLTACIFFAILLGGILLLSRYIIPVYAINDDMTIRSILSGAYTGMPDGHAIYMQYPLSGLLRLLYCWAKLPWFEIVSFVFIAGSMFVIIYDSGNRFLCVLLCVSVVYPIYFSMHYTTTAALLAAAAVLVVYRKEKVYLFPILWLLAYMLRKEIGMLCILFLALAFWVRFVNWSVEERKRNVKQTGSAIGVALLGWIICLLLNGFCYRSEEWKDFQTFNKYRVSLYDYTDFIPSEYYKDHCEAFGLTTEQHHILTTYNILLDKWLDTETITELSEKVAHHMEQNSSFVEEIVTAVKTYLSQVYYDGYPYNILCLAGYVFIGGYIVYKKCWKQLMPLAGVGVGKALVAIFLIVQGRFPERIAVSLYLIEILSLLGQFEGICDKRLVKRQKPLILLATVGCYLFLSVMGYSVLRNVWVQNQTALAYQKEWEQIKTYCAKNPDNIYWGYTFSIQSYTGMPYEDVAENLYMLGCWTANSPLIHTVYEELEVADAAESLVFHEKAHLLIEESRDITSLQRYFDNRFGKVAFEAVAAIELSDGNLLMDYQIKQVENVW